MNFHQEKYSKIVFKNVLPNNSNYALTQFNFQKLCYL